MTEIDIHADDVKMVKSLCYFCHANCGNKKGIGR